MEQLAVGGCVRTVLVQYLIKNTVHRLLRSIISSQKLVAVQMVNTTLPWLV